MSQKKIKSVLIDVDANDQEIFLLALSKTGLPVYCQYANDGRAGIELLAISKLLPDFVFLDLNMPILDGRSCLKVLREKHKLSAFPVII